MKEKIRALWAKIAPKVDPVLERIRVVSNRVLPHIGKHSRWVSYFVAVPILFTCIAGLGFFWIYPAYELRPWVTEKLVSQLKAQSLKVGEMSWDHSLSQLSLGVELKDIEIQKGAWFHSLKVDELRLSFSPIALLTAGTPFNLEANGLDANLKLSSPRRFVRPSKEVPAAPTTKSEQLVEWTRKLLSYAKGYKIKLERSKIQLELPVGAEDAQIPNMLQINLQDVDLEAELDASWRQKIHLKALAQAGTKSGSWILAGPLGLESQSTLSVREEDIPVSLDFKKFDLDLSETNFTGWGALERFAPGKFVIQAKPRVLFREEDSQLVIGELISGESHAFLDDLKIDLTSRYQPRKEFQLEWLVGRSEVKSLHLPLKWLRRAPGAGIVSSMGRLQLRERLDNSDFTWRFALNNFKIDAADLATIWGDQNSSSGPVLVSAVSEGRLQNGRLDSPRTEVQIDATAAEWDPPGSVFAKPAGHKAQLLLRMSHDDGGLKVSHLDLEMHTLKLEGQGHLKNLLGLLLSDEAAPYDLSLVSNNVDLSEWTSLFPSFRKIPLQGFFQTKGDFYGTYDPKDENTWSKIGWNFEKFHLSNIAGAFQRGENIDVAGMRQDMSGPFSMSFFFVGRGEGTRVNRATLLSQADLTNASIWFGEKFRKPQGTPLVFQFSADQSRNRVHIDKGSFRLADLDMNFSGDMIQGLGRSRLKVLLKDPIDLSTWKEFFPDAKLQQRVKGRIWLDGSLGLDSNFHSEQDIDWATLTFDGQTRFENFSWNADLLGNAFDSMSGKLRFSDRSIDFAPVEIRKGNQTYRLEGSLTPEPVAGKKKRSLYLIDWFLNPAWNLEANLQIPRIELSLLLKKLESKDRYTFPDAWIDEGWARNSRATLNLNIDDVQWESQPLFSKLMGKLEYNRGRSTLRPFSLLYKGGKVTGSATLDVSPAWVSDGEPQWAASVNVENLPIDALPFGLGFTRGSVKGESTFTSQGRYFSDWDKNARLRGLLQIGGLQGDVWTRPVKAKIDTFFDKSAASDYLLSDAARLECQPSPESALVEFQETHDKLELGRMRISTKGGGRLDLQADMSNATSAAREKLKGKAVYRFPAKCFSDRAQFCMKDLQRDVAWPLDFSKREVTLSELEYDFDVGVFARSFQACMERKVADDVKKQMTTESKPGAKGK